MSTTWNLHQLKDALRCDLEQCHTATERLNCTVIGIREIRQRANELSAQRKLTPGEVAIAKEAGWAA